MAHGIVKLNGIGYLCAALEGTPASWHNLEDGKRFKEWRDMWNATAGQVSVGRIELQDAITGAKYPNFGLRASFIDGTYEYPANGATCAAGYTPQNPDKLAELVGMVNAVFPLDYAAILDSGFSDVFSFNMEDWLDIANESHRSRLSLHTRNDKTGADAWVESDIRVVCANTRRAAERSGRIMRVRHSPDIDDRMRDITSPIIAAQISASADVFANDKAFYNGLLALPAPNKDLFIENVFGVKPTEGKAVAHWQNTVDKYFEAMAVTVKQSPQLENTAALWLNATTHNAKTARTKGDRVAVNAAKSLIGVNDGPVDLAYAFFAKAMETTTVALPSA